MSGLFLIVSSAACAQSPQSPQSPPIRARVHPDGVRIQSSARTSDPASYEGTGPAGIPRYARLRVSAQDSLVLRRAYGIENPRRLYISDSTPEGLLKYDTHVKTCRTCYVNSFRIGYVSVRRTGESWEQVERRVRATKPVLFSRASRKSNHSIADMDPAVQTMTNAMLTAARDAGFKVRVTDTYRSPLREAYLLSKGRGQTHTLTSNHSYGRALDITIDDGNRAHAKTRRDWIAFRRWLLKYATNAGAPLRVLGKPDRTWDWGHIEIPSSSIGFHSIDEAIARGRNCLRSSVPTLCDFPPHVPRSLSASSALQR